MEIGKFEYLGDDLFVFTNKDKKEITLTKNSNGDLVLNNSNEEFSVQFVDDKNNGNVLKVINATRGTLIDTEQQMTLNKDGYVLIGWERADDPDKAITKFNMPNKNVTLYPVWYVAEDYVVWLTLAGIENPESYNENSVYSNAELMSIIMENEKAVNYMIKNTNQMMGKVLNNTVSASALGESTIAKEKVHKDTTWVAAINNSSYSYKYLTSSLIPKMSSLNLNADGKSMTKNGITISVSDYQNTDCNIIKTADKDLSSLWLTASGSYGTHYYTVEFPDPICITSYYYNGNGWWANAQAYKFYMEASNDNINWTDLENGVIHNDSGSFSTINTTYTLDNTNAYKYYRIHYTAGGYTWGSNGGTPLYEIALYEI